VAVVAWMLVQLPDGHCDEGSRLALTAMPARMCRVIFHPFSHHRKRIGRWPVVSIAAVNGRQGLPVRSMVIYDVRSEGFPAAVVESVKKEARGAGLPYSHPLDHLHVPCTTEPKLRRPPAELVETTHPTRAQQWVKHLDKSLEPLLPPCLRHWDVAHSTLSARSTGHGHSKEWHRGGHVRARVRCLNMHTEVHKVGQVATKLRATDTHTRRGVLRRGAHFLVGGP